MEMEQGQRAAMQPGPVVAGVVLLALGGGDAARHDRMLSIEPGRLIAPFVLIAHRRIDSVHAGPLLHGDGPAPARHARRRRRFHGGALADRRRRAGCWSSQTHLFGLTFATSWPLW